jgi:hypothetical protein
MCTPPGSIYTVDDEDSNADCMLGEILAIGNAGIPVAPSPLIAVHYLNVANSEQIRKYWSAHKPNESLEMFQTPPGSIIVPGLAGMTLPARYLHDVAFSVSLLRCAWTYSRMGRQGTAPSRRLRLDRWYCILLDKP